MITMTRARATELAAKSDTNALPQASLNPIGQREVLAWIERCTEDTQEAEAWFVEAEQAANNAAPGEEIVLEMAAQYTVSGAPEVLHLDDEWFDWAI